MRRRHGPQGQSCWYQAITSRYSMSSMQRKVSVDYVRPVGTRIFGKTRATVQ